MSRNFQTFSVDVSEILAATKHLDGAAEALLPRLTFEIRGLAKYLLETTFLQAMIRANGQGGFPEPFQVHVLEVLQRLPIPVDIVGSKIEATIDFDLLGTPADLRTGFHQGAKLASGEYLWAPYTDQALISKSAANRYVAWNAVRNDLGGFKFGSDRGKKKARLYKLPDWASWENTMHQRIEIWGDKAPEWLYIQYGQKEWYPNIPVGTVFEDFYTQFNEESTALFEAALANYVEVLNARQGAGPFTFVPQQPGNVREASGRYGSAYASYYK